MFNLRYLSHLFPIRKAMTVFAFCLNKHNIDMTLNENYFNNALEKIQKCLNENSLSLILLN